MEQRIQECLQRKAPGEYIFPFFWQHGEDHDTLAREIDAIQNSGICEFCVESRVHEQFGEEKWWEDFGFLLEEARRRNMRVWLLDDKRFPTGYANNYIESHPKLRAVRLRMVFRDYAGPVKDGALIPLPLEDPEESIISAVAYRKDEKGDLVTGEGIQLTDLMENGIIWWDIPEGFYRVFYLIRTYNSPDKGKKYFMDVMNPESCKAMLHAVYDPHYEHFSEYFGNTFRGFFSDEPGFFNEDGTYYSTLGREKACLPWNDALPGMLSEKTGLTEKEILNLLPALYHEVEGRTALIREAYMDTATKLYSQNVAWLLGDWCRAHDVLYVGHIIEDMNAHQRLGHGAGHFFRAMDGQDMAGCDVVIHQIVPGFTDLEHSVQLAGDRAYPEFFNYTLPKLASSHAHIQPLKKGRAMCEIFGAFGWSEGIPFMKYLTDIMLVSGINHFVPHAFSAVYPDIPSPIFYSQGMSNYYPVFGELMGYMQRMSHTLTEGVHQADVAVYYNAEAEWAGGKCMLQDVVCQQLARHQIEYDLIPADVLKECSSILKGKLAVHEETYGALIVPYSQYLPEELLKRFVFLAKSGLPIYFVKDYPKGLNGGEFFPIAECVCESVPLDRLADRLISKGHRSLVPDQTIPFLRYFHIYRDGHDIYMLWNEDIHSKIDTTVRFLTAVSEPNAAFYDVWNNRLFSAAKGNSLRISLAPAQAVVVIFSQEEDFSSLPPYDYCEGEVQELNLTWKVSAREMNESEFKDIPLENGLCNLARKLPAFGGILRYESTWHTDCPDLCKYLECTNVGELARLWINDTYCGSIVSAPYRFHIEGMLREGDNHIRIEVCPNLGYRERDHLAAYLPLPPTGLIGPLYCRS